MLFRFLILKTLFLFSISLSQLAYGEETTRVVFYTKPVVEDWPDSYYLLYGFTVAAVVLFIMAVMKKHDQLS
ncbi:MAG: hypothetical protein V3U78_04865 [Thiotrichaceae bacterium]